MSDEACDVLIVGAGPAGLSAAARLKALGAGSVIVVDREPKAGGIPRYCRHSPFGMREFGRILGGQAYADRLAARAAAAGAGLRLGATVIDIERGSELVVSVVSANGPSRIHTRRLLLATGARETPRAALMVSGDRPLGILNTGALQVYAAKGLTPFRQPLVVGSELVSLSALLTCRAIGARPVMMIEERPAPLTRRTLMTLPHLLGIPMRYGARIADIRGGARVEAASLAFADGTHREVACDGVLFTGRFVPEASIARAAGLAIDTGTGGPAVDQFGRTSDARIFAAGNMLHPIETAGWCWAEARTIADFMAASLANRLPAPDRATFVHPGPGVAYAVPQRLVPGHPGLGRFQIRVEQPARSRLTVQQGAHTKMERRRFLAPARRLLVPIPPASEGDVTIGIKT